MEEENELGLSIDDQENLKLVLDGLIDSVVKFQGMSQVSTHDWSEFKAQLDFANFIVSGIIYANGLDICDHDRDFEGGDDE